MSDPISNATGIQNCLRGRREPKNRSEAPTRLKPLVAKVPVPAPILNRTAPTTNRYARIPDRLASISTSERVIVTGRSRRVKEGPAFKMALERTLLNFLVLHQVTWF